MSRWNRRQWLQAAGAAAAVTIVPARRAKAAARAVVQETKVISYQQNLYHGWPTVAQLSERSAPVVLLGRTRVARMPVWESGADAIG